MANKFSCEQSLKEFEKAIFIHLDWFKKEALNSAEVLNCQIMFSNSIFILKKFIEEKFKDNK